MKRKDFGDDIITNIPITNPIHAPEVKEEVKEDKPTL